MPKIGDTVKDAARRSDTLGAGSDESGSGSDQFRTMGAADSEVFEELLAEHRPDLVRYAYSIFGDWDCAEDVTHRAFLALLETGRKLDCSASVRAFLLQAVRHRSLKVARRRKTRRRLEQPARESLYDPPSSPEDVFADEECSDRLRQALHVLPPRRRQALVMAKLQGLSHRQIARRMKLSPQTVSNHVCLALKDLRDILQPLEGNHFRRI